jgi:hypothetical protein
MNMRTISDPMEVIYEDELTEIEEKKMAKLEEFPYFKNSFHNFIFFI